MHLCQEPVQTYLQNNWTESLRPCQSSSLCESLRELSEPGGYVQTGKGDGCYKTAIKGLTAEASNVFWDNAML